LSQQTGRLTRIPDTEPFNSSAINPSLCRD
jgi:hypothetical protein